MKKKDVEYIRALESEDTDKVQQIVAEKQALRDATKIIDDVIPSATDVIGITAELKQVWDTDLLGENPLV